MKTQAFKTIRVLNVVVVSIALVVSGCASFSGSIPPSLVDSSKYANHSCSRLTSQLERASKAEEIAAKAVNANAGQDVAIATIGILLFIPLAPILLFLGGGEVEEIEYARVAGEKKALEDAFSSKKCS